MQQYRRKDWLREAILLSVLIHILLVGLSFFIKMDRHQQLFYVTMASPAAPAPIVERQRVRPRPLPRPFEQPESAMPPALEEPLEPIINASDLALDAIELPEVAPQNSAQSPPLIVNEEVSPAPVVPSVSRPLTPPPSPPQTREPVVATPAPTPAVAVPKAEPSVPLMTPEPVVREEQLASQESAVESVVDEDVINDSQGSSTVSEQWRFLENSADSDEGQRSLELGQAIYSFQLSSRYVVREPDFSFLEDSHLSTNVSSIRVRLSILADGSIAQAVLLGGGTGDASLNNAFINSLLAMTFNDVSAARRPTQIGILTIRFDG